MVNNSDQKEISEFIRSNFNQILLSKRRFVELFSLASGITAVAHPLFIKLSNVMFVNAHCLHHLNLYSQFLNVSTKNTSAICLNSEKYLDIAYICFLFTITIGSALSARTLGRQSHYLYDQSRIAENLKNHPRIPTDPSSPVKRSKRGRKREISEVNPSMPISNNNSNEPQYSDNRRPFLYFLLIITIYQVGSIILNIVTRFYEPYSISSRCINSVNTTFYPILEGMDEISVERMSQTIKQVQLNSCFYYAVDHTTDFIYIAGLIQFFISGVFNIAPYTK